MGGPQLRLRDAAMRSTSSAACISAMPFDCGLSRGVVSDKRPISRRANASRARRRGRAVVAADLEDVRAPAAVRAIDGDPAITAPLGGGMALEQHSVRLHHPIDPLSIDRRPAMLGGSSSDQRVNPPIAASRQTGNDLFDLGELFRIRL
jgi:hypothetical protein